MRTVVSNAEVPHLWAHQTQQHARSGHVSFDGERLYSYAACIGRIVTVKGQKIALFVDHTWSVTTSRHQNEMRSAASHLPHFEVSSVGGKYDSKFSKENHTENLEHYETVIENFVLLASRARTKADWYLGSMNSKIEEAKRYCATFKLSAKRFENLDHDGILAGIKEKIKKQEAAAKVAQKKREQQEREFLEEQKKLLPEWLNGKSDKVPRLRTHYARIEGKEIVTTLGVRFPLKDAKRALPLVKRIVVSETEWQSNGEQIPLGSFKIDHISASGAIRAGCHLLEGDEVRRLIKLIDKK